MSRTPFTVPPGKNKMLARAWADHKAAQKAEGKKKPDPVEAVPVKKAAKKTAKKGRKR